MTGRNDGLLKGVHFCGDSDKMVFHDLNKETPNCCIDDLLTSDKIVVFKTLFEAINAGYLFCKWCVGGAYKIHQMREKGMIPEKEI